MINNAIHVHGEGCTNQMNIKLLSLNNENENFEYTSIHNMFWGSKRGGGATIRGGAIIRGNTVLVLVTDQNLRE